MNRTMGVRGPVRSNIDAVLSRLFQIEEHATSEQWKECGATETFKRNTDNGREKVRKHDDVQDRARNRSF